MAVTIIIGGQWGDEAKGKITDVLAAHANMVIRPNGSTNAGHTVQTSAGLFKFHLVPAGILRPGCDCIIGAGVAIPPADLLAEIADLTERGIDMSRLFISDRANIIMPYHPLQDQLEERQRGSHNIGTTLRGNGPAYADKAGRRGIRVADLLDESALVERLNLIVPEKNVMLTSLYNEPPIDIGELLESFAAFGEKLAPRVVSAEVMVQDAIEAGKSIIVESAQAAMLDIDYGTYPYVTSTSPTAAGACQGAGIGPTQVDHVVSVYKAYTTRVGGGPYPTELVEETGELLRQRGKEFGTSTGRPRRTGWFDGVAARYATRLNGVTHAAITKLDILDPLDEIQVCVGYEQDGERVRAPHAIADIYGQVKPIFETLPGWQEDTSNLTRYDELPVNARRYIDRLEEVIGVPVVMIGLGPSRDQLLWRREVDFA
ncbi:MAG TPA: adenylosuccinate synthase [Nitrolancea sp.]|nr:adenylosuccinate synthase [Nitrolancea sp.]